MKTLNLIGAILVTVGTCSAQTGSSAPGAGPTDDSQTPDVITNRFNTDYPNTHPTWSQEGTNYRADYTMGSAKRSITYAVNGRVLSRDEEIRFGSYPESIDEYYNHKFPNESYAIWLNTDVDGNRIYYVHHNAETLWFDIKGKYKKVTRNRIVEPNPQATARESKAEAIKLADQ